MPDFAAAFALGLLGSSHCLIMCGGIASALGLATGTDVSAGAGAGAGAGNRALQVLWFQIGRISSYTLLGAGLGGLLGLLATPTVLPFLSFLSGCLLLGMGLYLGRWWLGLQWLGKGGSLLWRRVQPLAGRFLPADRPAKALAVGACWGLLPCGLIYSALAWSAAAAHPLTSALLMLTFGLGTLPSMLSLGLAAQTARALLGNRHLRAAAALCLIALGAWTLFETLIGAFGTTLNGETSGGHRHGGI